MEWAGNELAAFVKDLDWYDWGLYRIGGNFDDKPDEKDFKAKETEILQRWPIVLKILRRLPDMSPETPVLERGDNGSLVVGKIQDMCHQALGLARRHAEIEICLGPDGPQLPADLLHAWVWEAARSLWDTRHYREAVQVAATSVNAHLQHIAGRRDVSDYRLVTELFSEKDPEVGRPRLRWPGDPSDEQFRSMQAGLRGYGAGVFQCIRNPATHDLDELSEQDALERLASLSLFCKWVGACKVVRAA
jgi:hypothetical protein